MNMLISNSFPSQLSSFTFISNCEEEGESYYFNSNRFRCVECLQTTNTSIIIQDYMFKEPKHLCDSIKFFKKAQCIEFKDWEYHDWEVGMEDIKFEGVMFKQIVFTDCWFANTKIIKKVIIDSGMAKMLDRVTFNGFMNDEEDEDVEKMIEEYKIATGKINMKVV